MRFSATTTADWRIQLITLIKSLQAQEVPVHAIGSQAPVNVSTSFETMNQALTEMCTLGLPIHITELEREQLGERQRRSERTLPTTPPALKADS